MKLCACGCGLEKKGRGIYRPNHRPEDTFAARGVICACGCGGTIPTNRHKRYYEAKFLVGHNMRIGPPLHVYIPNPEEIPSGLCECGCGRSTPIAEVTNQSLRWFRNHPKPFVPGHHARVTARKRMLTLGNEIAATEAAYFAGILDGEGTITFRGDRSVRITIGNTSWPLMEWLCRYGGTIHAVKEIPNRLPVWRWSISHRSDVIALLRVLEPYLLIKRDRAREAITRLEPLPAKSA